MIYFMDKDLNTVEGTPTHIGESQSYSKKVSMVEYAQADGDELHAAMIMFPNINVPVEARVFTYSGDFAKMLYMNWR